MQFSNYDFIESKSGLPPKWNEAAVQLGKLHKSYSDIYGLNESNFIGRTLQLNKPNINWPKFFQQNRLIPQINMAKDARLIGQETYNHLLTLNEELLSWYWPEDLKPTLCHGDLWSGNIIFNNEQMPSLLEYEIIRDRLIVLEGWSKTYCMTGWRLGWSIWPDNLIEHANKICVNYNSCATSISQYAGLEAIKGSQKEITKIVSEFQKRKEYVFNELNKLEKISCFEPGGAFYAFPNISKTGLSGNKFSEIALEEKGVALVPGSSFGDNAGEFVRISFANSLENIKEAINRLSTI